MDKEVRRLERYRIGDVLLCWDGGGYRLQEGQYMERFRWDGPWDGDRICLRGRYEPLTPYRDCPLLLQRDLFSVYDVQGERLLLYHWSYLRDGYGIWLDRVMQGREDAVSFDPAMDTQIPLPADWFFGVCGLNKLMLMRDKPVFHAAYIDIGGSAVLFAAPSQTGKTTQAKLWEQYGGARMINGDRVLLGKRNGLWHAYGYPNCGSSDVCIDRTLPIRAVVILSQSPENTVEPMTAMEKLRSLVSGTVVYSWDSEDMEKALQLAQDLIERVPVVRLACRPDAGAVEVLKNWLEVRPQ